MDDDELDGMTTVPMNYSSNDFDEENADMSSNVEGSDSDDIVADDDNNVRGHHHPHVLF